MGAEVAGEALEFGPHAGTLVLQPTPLCNLRCTYCYLADLSDRSRMAPAVAERLADALARSPNPHPVELLWHGGEPLTVGVSYFESLLQPFESLRVEGRVGHAVQTNGTLLSPQWCELFRRYEVGVGLSIDGPRWANEARRSLSGAETFERVMRGVACLNDAGQPFSAIAVVSCSTIPEIVERCDEFFDFFRSIGAREVGFNIEEREGRHLALSDEPSLVPELWGALFDSWLRAGGVPSVRNFSRVLDFAHASLDGTAQRLPIDLFPTVTHEGDVVLLAPELAGHRDERYEDFKVGNVLEDPLELILERGVDARYVREFREGSEGCRVSCRYFDCCQGGSASNRYFEHGDLVTHETEFCRLARQAPFDTVVGSFR